MLQFTVGGVMQPSDDFDAIGVLPFKVLFDVIDDDSSLQVATQQVKVFDIDAVVVLGVLAVESVLDIGLGRVEHVQDPVRVVLGSCCEDHYFIDFA